MSQVNYKDTVKINHPEFEGTGIVTKFHNDKYNGVEIEVIKLRRRSDGKEANPGRKFNMLQEYLTTIKEYDFPGCTIEDDTVMAELFKSEEEREEKIGVVTPEFVGRWR